MLSVILPAYNEETMISIATKTILGILDEARIDCEVIIVDDGSRDNSWSAIKEVSLNNRAVRGIHFSRNFGKESAMFAGLESASGDCCVILDCDLQHPPEKIVEMYNLWQKGYEVVEGVKDDRGKESMIHSFAAGSFYKLISKAANINMENSSDFKLLDRKVVDVLNQMPERSVFFRALSYWVGFKRAEVTYSVQERKEGESKWSTVSLIKYAINNIGSFSSAPLQITTALGLIMLVISFVFGIVSLIQKIAGQVQERVTIVIFLLLFSASLILICLGIIGYYLARVYEEIKGRPRYIVAEECGILRDE